MSEHDSDVLNNARRLSADAQLLFAHARYSSALALAILALEEAGKHVLSLWEQEDAEFSYKKGVTVHKIKQSVSAALYVASVVKKSCDSFLIQLLAYLIKYRNYTDDDLKEVIGILRTRAPQQIVDGMSKIVTKDMAEEKNTSILAYARMGAIEKLKQAAFYVDIKGREQFPRIKIQEKDAKEFIEHAENAITMSEDSHLRAIAKAIFQSYQ